MSVADDPLSPFGVNWKRLLRRLTRVTGSADAAEDALQGAYLRLEEFRQTNVVRSAPALLARMAVNLALDERRRGVRFAWNDIADVGLDLADDHPLQDEVLAARERLSLVKAALAAMPPRTRDVFLMHRIDGLKYREIAERLGVSQSAVEKQIARACLLLADAMHASGDGS